MKMKFKLKDMNTGDKFLMISSHGYGLCLFEVVEQVRDYPHGFDCLNLFTEDLEFKSYTNTDGTDNEVYYIDNSADAKQLIHLHNKGI